MGKLEAKGAGLSLQVLSGCSQVMKGTCYLLPSLETRGSALYNATVWRDHSLPIK
jgi:hypothetical protein